ncbi:glycosyl transferase family 1 [Pontibacter ummariensis]|uniref:Glycosyl transferases group 1 n=1 Tax=Pontibacter ummariensis TaxID=1610492 RepID=A0A239K6A0_9BACT|nr:glycosyltransferase family 4 protein [Pontibacter ummariensis]PRY06757.1 glycosyl transferase family 1 [Pontibacter ummariensis]SNT13212.1 Glycosyl transferases group 1 [Pontibacter ummariensis]
MNKKFICFHLGARSHYLIPTAMEQGGKLAGLITDTWISSAICRTFLIKVPLRQVRSLSNRYCDKIISKHVSSYSLSFIFFELYLRIAYQQEWSRILFRNRVFQQKTVNELRKFPNESTVFGTSYTSLEVFKAAKKRGQRTVLFQIDPGYREEEIVSQLVEQNTYNCPTKWEPAPDSYWHSWREECGLADCIMVNSVWSKNKLTEQGISPSKICVIPLPFKLEDKHLNFKKEFPKFFSESRPLRCLFLGTLSVRKGIHLVLNVAEYLKTYPVEFVLVGQSELFGASLELSNVTYKGVSTRAETDLHYQLADIFLFPTFSDGFGLTQLEAMAWQLPVIASTNCGKVVEHQINGIEMASCSTESLAESVLEILQNPSFLQFMSANCIPTVKQFCLERFSKELSGLL